jgi:hypothetical protein
MCEWNLDKEELKQKEGKKATCHFERYSHQASTSEDEYGGLIGSPVMGCKPRKLKSSE